MSTDEAPTCADDDSPDPRAAMLSGHVRELRRRKSMRAALITLPAFAFVLFIFVLPIAAVLYRAVDGGSARVHLPKTATVLATWNGKSSLPEAAFGALADDFRAIDLTTVADLARDLNSRRGGFGRLAIETKRSLDAPTGHPVLADLVAIDSRWADLAYWRTLQSAMRPFTAYYVLAALDLRQSDRGGIERAPENRRIYIGFVARTFWICFMVTVTCVIAGYPVAYLIAHSTPATARILMYILLLPFWTSILVRTAAWAILLQPNGIVNTVLKATGLIVLPMTLIYNRFGVCVAMTHVLLPFMIFPIYGVIKAIPKNLMPAAASLGAAPGTAFREVYLPLSMPGLSAGCLMTFVLGLGYYVTPALVGGPGDQMESGLIARFALGEANWPMASAISLVLLAMMALAFIPFLRLRRVIAPD
jgi:putative spermidine/putrescine transport system permease protein